MRAMSRFACRSAFTCAAAAYKHASRHNVRSEEERRSVEFARAVSERAEINCVATCESWRVVSCRTNTGKANKEIASAIAISERTVKTQVATRRGLVRLD